MRAIAGSERQRLCAVLGHELRNPLASALTSVTVAAEMTDRGDPRTPFLAQTVRDLERLSRILNAYLDEGPRAASRRRRTDLVHLVDQIRARWNDGGVSVNGSPGTVFANVDRELLGRALENIIENSFGVGATRVEIGVSRAGDRAVVDIVDDGPGVPEELRERIFEPCVSGRGGTGIGLALARDVLGSHGGTIEHIATERGARFRVSLPAIEAARSTAEPQLAT